MKYWLIEEHDDGRLTLSEGRKVRLQDATQDQVDRYLAKYMGSDDAVSRAAPDGYRTRERGPKRRHWRQP